MNGALEFSSFKTQNTAGWKKLQTGAMQGQIPPCSLQAVHLLILLVIATTLEVSGDAALRMAIYDHAGALRILLFVAGTALLFGYGSFLNLAPLDFGRVVGLYIATLFVVWQLVNYIAFRALPTLPTLVGGALILTRGAIITFWRGA